MFCHAVGKLKFSSGCYLSSSNIKSDSSDKSENTNLFKRLSSNNPSSVTLYIKTHRTASFNLMQIKKLQRITFKNLILYLLISKKGTKENPNSCTL